MVCTGIVCSVRIHCILVHAFQCIYVHAAMHLREIEHEVIDCSLHHCCYRMPDGYVAFTPPATVHGMLLSPHLLPVNAVCLRAGASARADHQREESLEWHTWYMQGMTSARGEPCMRICQFGRDFFEHTALRTENVRELVTRDGAPVQRIGDWGCYTEFSSSIMFSLVIFQAHTSAVKISFAKLEASAHCRMPSPFCS